MPLPTVAADADEATEGERVILVAVLAGCSESLSDDVTPKLYLLLLKKIRKSRCPFVHFSDPPFIMLKLIRKLTSMLVLLRQRIFPIKSTMYTGGLYLVAAVDEEFGCLGGARVEDEAPP